MISFLYRILKIRRFEASRSLNYLDPRRRMEFIEKTPSSSRLGSSIGTNLHPGPALSTVLPAALERAQRWLLSTPKNSSASEKTSCMKGFWGPPLPGVLSRRAGLVRTKQLYQQSVDVHGSLASRNMSSMRAIPFRMALLSRICGGRRDRRFARLPALSIPRTSRKNLGWSSHQPKVVASLIFNPDYYRGCWSWP